MSSLYETSCFYRSYPVDMLPIYLTAQELSELPEYSATNPTGCYPGKLWKAHPTKHLGNNRWIELKHWVVRQYALCDDPNSCRTAQYRPVVSRLGLRDPRNDHVRTACGFRLLSADYQPYWDDHMGRKKLEKFA